MRQKVLFFLLLLLVIFPIGRVVWQKWEYYLSPFDLELMKASYERSQYVREDPEGWLPDEFHFAYASWYYINGGNPILVNPDYPPLGKYIIGASIKLFNNEKIPTLFFAFLSLFSLFLVSKTFFGENWLALLPVVLFASGKLFQEQLLYLPLFEIFTLAFLNLAFYFFIKAESESRHFLLANLFLGLLWATKPWMLTVPLMASWLAYLSLIKKDLRKTAFWLVSLPVAVTVLVISYFKLFLEGWSLYKVLSVQKWILWYHRSKLIKFGSIWPFIYLKRWYVWWGDKPYLPIVQWNIFWPVFTSLALIFSILTFLKTFGLKKKWLKKFQFDKRITSLCLWVVFYLVFFSVGNVSVRYVFYLLPFCYLLGIYFLRKIWVFVAKKLLSKIELKLVEDELVHFFSPLIVGLILKTIYQDWRLVAATFLFGFFVDIDHWYDYFALYGVKMNLRNFFVPHIYARASKKVYIPLHGWEYVALFWVAGRWIGVAGLEWAMSLSYLAHLLWDNFTFQHHPLAYLFTYRLLNGFSLESFEEVGSERRRLK